MQPHPNPPLCPIGSLGNISKFPSFSDLSEVNCYLSLNVSSALALTAGLLKVFPRRPGLRWSVVNVSSLFAVQPLPNWVLYCTAKAARKMMFSVLAAEEPNVKVLSYSPGTHTFTLTKIWPPTIPFLLSSMNACHKAQRQHLTPSNAEILPQDLWTLGCRRTSTG